MYKLVAIPKTPVLSTDLVREKDFFETQFNFECILTKNDTLIVEKELIIKKSKPWIVFQMQEQRRVFEPNGFICIQTNSLEEDRIISDPDFNLIKIQPQI